MSADEVTEQAKASGEPGGSAAKHVKTTTKGKSRPQSSIQFPYNDLEDAEEIALTIFKEFGGTCDIGHIAAAFNQSPTSGAFRTKILSSKMFGLVDGTRTLALTSLGYEIMDIDRRNGALVTAFLNVPLFDKIADEATKSNGMLPSSGLAHLIARLGVVKGQLNKAQQVFMRSARQAGFYEYGEDRFVRPRITAVPVVAAPDLPGALGRTYKGAQPDISEIQNHPLMAGLLATLPNPGSVFPKDKRQRWLDALSVNFDFIYESEDTGSSNVATAAKEGSDGEAWRRKESLA